MDRAWKISVVLLLLGNLWLTWFTSGQSYTASYKAARHVIAMLDMRHDQILRECK